MAGEFKVVPILTVLQVADVRKEAGERGRTVQTTNGRKVHLCAFLIGTQRKLKVNECPRLDRPCLGLVLHPAPFARIDDAIGCMPKQLLGQLTRQNALNRTAVAPFFNTAVVAWARRAHARAPGRDHGHGLGRAGIAQARRKGKNASGDWRTAEHAPSGWSPAWGESIDAAATGISKVDSHLTGLLRKDHFQIGTTFWFGTATRGPRAGSGAAGPWTRRGRAVDAVVIKC